MFSDINVVINPMEVSVVRGDRSSRPTFLCVAFGYPAPTLTWSAIYKLYDAKQLPVSTIFNVIKLYDVHKIWCEVTSFGCVNHVL